MKTILITGCNGQLGREMRNLLEQRTDLKTLYTDVAELDITNSSAVNAYVADNAVNVIVNCAAYTAVDKAESDEDFCELLNAKAVENLAVAAKYNDAMLVHVSTDYVFAGDSDTPYKEDDATGPQSVYGRTKLAGEKAIQSVMDSNYVIVRTAWLYSPYGKNFVKTMLNLGKTKAQISVVADQKGTPTYAHDLAKAIVRIVDSKECVSGVYHYTDGGETNWYEFTKEIHRQACIETCEVKPITTAEYPTAAHRPAYSVLSKEKIVKDYGVEVPQWQVSLRHCLNRIEELS